MTKKKLITLATAMGVAAAAFAAPASAQQHPSSHSPPEASIPFVSFRNVRDFEADGRYAVYLQDQRRNWYHATLLQPCFDLPFVHKIGVDTRGGNNVDQFSTLIVGGDRCRIESLVRSGPPPKKAKKAGRRA